MAIVKVSQAGGVATAANTPAGNTGAVGGTFSAGNLLVAIVGWSYSGVGASVTIDVPAGWTAPLATQNNTAPNTGARAYYMASNPGGAQTWTWNATANGGGTLLEWGFTIVEFSGADPLAPVDLAVIANNNAATASVTVDTLAASGTTLSGDALVQMVFAVKSTTPTWTSSASSVPTAGWTVGTGFDGTLGTSPFPHLTAQWQILAGTQAAPRGVMTASATVSFVTFLFTFKQPSVAGGVISQQRILRLRNTPLQWTAFSVTATPISLAPAIATLVLTGFAPTVSTPSTVTPAIATLTLTGFAPSAVLGTVLTPAAASLVLTGFAPTVSTPVAVTPAIATLILTGSTGTVSVGVFVQPAAATLTLTGFAPTVATPVTVTPAIVALVLSTFAPSVAIGFFIQPASRALLLATFAPTVTTPQTITPAVLALLLSTFAPTVGVGGSGPSGTSLRVTVDSLEPTSAFTSAQSASSATSLEPAPGVATVINSGGASVYGSATYPALYGDGTSVDSFEPLTNVQTAVRGS